MSQYSSHHPNPPDLETITALELAAYLGVSLTFIRRLVSIKKIPYIKMGRRVLFYLPAIREWLYDNTTWPGPHTSDWHRRDYDPVAVLKKLMDQGDKNFGHSKV